MDLVKEAASAPAKILSGLLSYGLMHLDQAQVDQLVAEAQQLNEAAREFEARRMRQAVIALDNPDVVKKAALVSAVVEHFAKEAMDKEALSLAPIANAAKGLVGKVAPAASKAVQGVSGAVGKVMPAATRAEGVVAKNVGALTKAPNEASLLAGSAHDLVNAPKMNLVGKPAVPGSNAHLLSEQAKFRPAATPAPPRPVSAADTLQAQGKFNPAFPPSPPRPPPQKPLPPVPQMPATKPQVAPPPGPITAASNRVADMGHGALNALRQNITGEVSNFGAGIRQHVAGQSPGGSIRNFEAAITGKAPMPKAAPPTAARAAPAPVAAAPAPAVATPPPPVQTPPAAAAPAPEPKPSGKVEPAKKTPWLSTKNKLLLGGGMLGAGTLYAGSKALGTARDYMMVPSYGSTEWGHGPQMPQSVNQYGYAAF